MSDKETLKLLVNSIKTGAKFRQEKLTNEQIAASLGVKRGQFQKYLSGVEPIPNDTFAILKSKS